MRSTSSVRKMTATARAGFTSGRVIRQNRCQAVGAVDRLASYTSALMPCRPARISSAMNGVVFQTSAITTADRAGHVDDVHAMCVPNTLFRMPCGSKMTTHSLDVTAVGIAQGIRMAARTMARPRKARFIISAKPMPMTVSNDDRYDSEHTVTSQVPELRAERARSGKSPRRRSSGTARSSQCL